MGQYISAIPTMLRKKFSKPLVLRIAIIPIAAANNIIAEYKDVLLDVSERKIMKELTAKINTAEGSMIDSTF